MPTKQPIADVQGWAQGVSTAAMDGDMNVFAFRDILDHQGPLKSTGPKYNGSSYTVLVAWEDGSETRRFSIDITWIVVLLTKLHTPRNQRGGNTAFPFLERRLVAVPVLLFGIQSSGRRHHDADDTNPATHGTNPRRPTRLETGKACQQETCPKEDFAQKVGMTTNCIQTAGGTDKMFDTVGNPVLSLYD